MNQTYQLNEGFRVFNEENRLLFVNKDDAITIELPGHLEEYESIISTMTAQVIQSNNSTSEAFNYLLSYLLENNIVIPVGNLKSQEDVASSLSGSLALASNLQIFGKSELAVLITEQLDKLNAQKVVLSETYSDTVQENSFPIVIIDGVNNNAINDLHERLFTSGQAWMLVEPYNGHSVTIGPIFLPRATGCLQCFDTRRAANLNLGLKNISYYDVTARGKVSSSYTAIAATHASLMCQQWLKDNSPDLPGKFYTITFDKQFPTIQTHQLLRLPRCPACSKIATRPVNVPWAETLHTVSKKDEG